MILVWLIILLMGGGLLAWLAGRWSTLWPRVISLLSTSAMLVILIGVWVQNPSGGDQWIATIDKPWIPTFGIDFSLAMDGLSLIMLLLTAFLGMLSVLASWKGITKRVGFFHFNLMFILAGITGVFLSMDLFLFYFFWEVMLIPMYFLIAIWGYERRTYAAYKFFIFTQASGLLMFLAILGLYFIHGQQTGNYTFGYHDLLGTQMNPTVAFWLMMGFLIAFLVKLPSVPFHNWLPDAHTQAPTAGSVILAGLLLKTGAYGIIRFVIPLFPEQSVAFAPVAMILGIVSILYGAKLAFSQTDLKRLVAYTSVSHMGFVLLGVYAFNELALQGTVMQMIAHGISTGALFIMVGILYERIHTRDVEQMGGMWPKVPRMAVIGLIFVMASLGLPGLGNFIAEFAILAGAYLSQHVLTIIATVGLVAATIYALRIMQKVFYGQEQKSWELPDMNLRESVVMLSLVGVIVWLGLYPQPVFNTTQKAIDTVLQSMETETAETGCELDESPSAMNTTDLQDGSENVDFLTSEFEMNQGNINGLAK